MREATKHEGAKPERTVATYCRICEAACGLLVTIDADERIIGIRPDRDHVVSRGFACLKGLKFAAIHHDPDRLQSPLRRVDHPDGSRTFEPVPWDEALEDIGYRLREIRRRHGDHSLGMYLGNPSAFSAVHSFTAFGFMKGSGSRNFFTSGSQDCNNKFFVGEQMYGNGSAVPIPDIDRTDCMILFGANPSMSQMTLVHAPRAAARLKAVGARGGRVYVVDPRRSETAATGTHVFIRPGTDVYLLLGFLAEIIRRDRDGGGLIDRVRVSEVMAGLDEVEAAVEGWTPAQVAAVTGVDEATQLELIDAYLGAPTAVLYLSTGVNQSRHGTVAYWLSSCINAITGNLDRSGGSIFGSSPFDVSKLASADTSGTEVRSRIGGYRAVVDTLPAGVLADEILTPGVDQIRALIVSAGNPVLTVPNGDHLEAALESLDLLVAIDLYRNRTSRHAHYILPATDFLERNDCTAVQAFGGFHLEPYMQYTPAVVRPTGEQRNELDVFADIAHHASIPMFGVGMAKFMALGRLPLVGRRLRLTGSRATRLLSRLGRLPARKALRKYPHGKLSEPNRPGSWLESKRVRTSDHRVQLAPALLLAEVSVLAAEFAAEEAALESTGTTLRLIGRRERHTHNSWTHNAEVFVGGRRDRNRLLIHPDDATDRGIGDGATVVVATTTGSIEVEASISDEVMPGTVSLPHGWGHQSADGMRVAAATAGANSNALAADGPGSLEQLAGMAHLTGFPVEVTAV